MPEAVRRTIVIAALIVAAGANALYAVAAEETPAIAPPSPPKLSMMAQAAMNAASTVSNGDKLSSKLEGITVPDWTANPAQVFVNTPQGFITAGGATAMPLPEVGTPAVLQEYGCTHVLSKIFECPQRTVQVSVFSFLNPSGAYGAYTTMRRGSQTIVVRGDASSEDDRSVSFWKGRRFVVISTPKDDDDVSKATVSRLADQVAVAINEHADMPPLLMSLPYMDRIKGSERFFLGPQAARRYITLPHFSRLGADNATGQALAEYSWLSPFSERMKALVIDYPNPDQANRAFAAYSSALSHDHKTWAVEPSAQLCKINGNFSWCAARGTHLYIILGARHKESALLLARQMAY